MKLSEAIREWKRNINTHMAGEYVLTLRADINAFSDAAHVLEGENAKLREDNDRLIQAVEDLHDVKLEDKLVQLENENDKLRELLCELYEDQCDECDRWKYRDRMRELRIEVGVDA